MVSISKGLAGIVTALILGCSGNNAQMERKISSPACQKPAITDASNTVHAKHRLNVKNESPAEINRILSTLERVPDPLQKIVNDYGATVVIFDGVITDNESMGYWKGVQIPKWSEGKTYDILPGAYSRGYKEALVHQKPSPGSHGSVSLELHEYGHAAAYALGELVDLPEVSDVPYFVSVHKDSRKYENPDGSLRMSNYGYNYRDEFFAESFAKFYSSSETKDKLREDFPETYSFLLILEKLAADGSFANLNKLDYGGNKPHSVEYQKGDAPQGKCVVY